VKLQFLFKSQNLIPDTEKVSPPPLTQVPTVCSDRKTSRKAGLPFPVSGKKGKKKTKKQRPFTVKSIQVTETEFLSYQFVGVFFQVCLFCPLLTTHVPLAQLINNVFYCYRQPVLPNTIAGKAWRDCRVQVFGALWSSKPDAEEMEHLFPFFSVLENTALCRATETA